MYSTQLKIYLLAKQQRREKPTNFSAQSCCHTHIAAFGSAPLLSSAAAAAAAPFSAALCKGEQPWAFEAPPPPSTAPASARRSTAEGLSRAAATNRHCSRRELWNMVFKLINLGK